MAKMNPKVKKLWVNALRSGKYKKGTKKLHNREEDTYCVMGVLCKLHAHATHKRGFNFMENHEAYDDYDMYYLGECVVIPNAVKVWSGIHTTHPLVHKEKSLVHWNDHSKKSFNELADMIEKYL